MLSPGFDQAASGMRGRFVFLAATLALAPAYTQGDLRVWWERGFREREDGAITEIVAEFGGA
jgi:hypothetical protein